MTKPSIPVGIVCSQSGPYQAMGREILKSALMAVDEINNSADFDFTLTAHVRDPRGVGQCPLRLRLRQGLYRVRQLAVGDARAEDRQDPGDGDARACADRWPVR